MQVACKLAYTPPFSLVAIASYAVAVPLKHKKNNKNNLISHFVKLT